jgi:NitT/TauT family transport system substrate-binding protein
MIQRFVALAVLLVSVLATSANADDQTLTKVKFVTDWKAQAEHGGFYQAVAEGRYKAKGLEVEIIQGGPAVNIPQLLAAGAADFGMGSNSFIPLNLVAADAKVRAVAAIFQKDPQVLIAHPRDDVNSIADMKGKPIMVSDATIGAFWVWLRAKYGFEDSQIRKYTFNLAPFLTDQTAIQQGYLSSEPYLIKKEGGFEPEVYLLSDYGYPGYANFILAPQTMIDSKREVVAAFVVASIEGWASYLTGDPAAANALIRRDNPEMTDDVLAQAIEKMKSYGIVQSGDAETAGIGVMTDARWKEFFEVMSAQGIYPADLTYRDAYTLEFVTGGQQ